MLKHNMQTMLPNGTIDPATKDRLLQPGHWDVQLLEFLRTDLARECFQYCYVYPPIGNYYEHPSGCDKKLKDGRPACWNEKWVCPGTRKAQDPDRREKYLARLTRKGNADWIGDKLPPLEYPISWVTLWCGQGDIPLMNEYWRLVFGEDDPRVRFAICAERDPERYPWYGNRTVRPGPDDIPVKVMHTPSKIHGDQSGVPLATDEFRRTDRYRRLRGHAMHQRSFRFWLDMTDDGKMEDEVRLCAKRDEC